MVINPMVESVKNHQLNKQKYTMCHQTYWETKLAQPV